MNIGEKAARIRTLRKDDTFQEVLAGVKQQQVSVFLTSSSSAEEREEAHGIIRALEQIEGYLDSVITEEKVQGKRNK